MVKAVEADASGLVGDVVPACRLLPPGPFDVVSVVVTDAVWLEVLYFESVSAQVRHSVAEPFVLELDAEGVHVGHNVGSAREVLRADRVHVGHDVSLDICEYGEDRVEALDALRVHVGHPLDDIAGTLVLRIVLELDLLGPELELPGTELELELLGTELEVQVEHKVLVKLLDEFKVQVGHEVLVELLEVSVQVGHKVPDLLDDGLDVQAGYKVVEIEMRVLDADVYISELGKADELETHVEHIVDVLL